MDQKAIETILRFYLAKLPESDLRELDDLLAEQGTSLDVPRDLDKPSTPAMDAAFGSAERQRFLKLGPRARRSIRHGKLSAHRGMAADSAEAVAYHERFPNADRLANGR